MLKWIKLWWKAWQVKRNYPKFELERAFLESEAIGCRDSAETLERNCRMIWRRFGWWEYEDSTAVVRLNNAMFTVLGDRDRAAMVAIGVASWATRQNQTPWGFFPGVYGILSTLCVKGIERQITDADKRALVELFPSIIRDMQMRDKGLPTVEQVLIWIARGDEFRGWGCTC